MAHKITIFAIVLSVLVLSVYAQSSESAESNEEAESCQRGEVYMECSSRCAERKCKPSEPQICPAICAPGCFCKEGYARNNNGVCVPGFMCVYKNYYG